MALPNFWGQKNAITALDISGLTGYANALNACAASLNACWDGNIDKQYVIAAINKQLQAVNQLRQDTNWVRQTADFVLVKLNELGALTGFSQPYVASVAAIIFSGGCAAKTRIVVDTGAIRAAAEALQGKRPTLASSQSSISFLLKIIDAFILGIWGIGGKLNASNQRVAEVLDRHDRIVAVLRKVADIYDQADHRLNKKASALQSPGLLNPTPYSFLSPALIELLKRYAKDLYDKIKEWLYPEGQVIEDNDKTDLGSSQGVQNGNNGGHEGIKDDQPKPEVAANNGTHSTVWPISPDAKGYVSWKNWPKYNSTGKPHNGTDFAASAGTPIYATHTGTVHKVGYDANGYGHYVVMKCDVNGETVYIYYAHMQNKPNLQEGQTIAAGTQQIGAVGSTGNSTGPHLHYEVRDQTNKQPALNPYEYLPQ